MRFSKWARVGGAVIIGAVGIGYWASQGPEIAPRNLQGLTGDVNRGAYVARLSGCIACHTGAKTQRGVLAGGAAIATPFGAFYAPNITPHEGDGVGGWTLNQFARALDGESPEGEHYFPAFPYAFYTRLTDQDVVDLWAAVNSVPSVEGGPPVHDVGFPFSFRPLIGIWKRLYYEPGRLDGSFEEDDVMRRGRYLVEGPGHCAACHTPRNFMGGRMQSAKLSGGAGPGGEKVPGIDGAALAAAGWSETDLRYALRSGLTPSGDVLGGSMAEVVRDGTRFWSDEDLEATAKYLLSLGR